MWYIRFNSVSSNVVVEWLPLLLRIREVPDTSLGPKTGYPDWRFRGFPQSYHANDGIGHDRIFSNSLLISHPVIRRYVVWATNRVVK
jgi:hypothetical protein